MSVLNLAKKASLMVTVVATISALSASTIDRSRALVGDAMTPLPPGAIKIEGHLGAQIDLAIRNRVAAQDVEALLRPFRDRRDHDEWRSEFWGKWITSAIAAWCYNGDQKLRGKIDEAVSALIATQTPDGYIGTYPAGDHLQRWDIWGRKYTLLGLLAWHGQTGDPAALNAARKEADLLLSEVGPGKASPFTNDMWHGMASSSVLEPMVLLFRRTGDIRYLEFANYLVNLWATPEGPDLLRKALDDVPVFKMFPGPEKIVKGYHDNGKSKAYEMMSCYEGLTELYRSTGNAEYRMAAAKVFANIRDSEITICGSGSDWERWCDGRRRQAEPWQKGMETCVTVTWMKFGAQLLRLTGESTYADEIEIAMFNALLGAQSIDGAWWCGDTPLAGIKEPAEAQCGVQQNCCVANGPRGLMLLPIIAVMSADDGPVINLYGKIRASAELPSGGMVDLVQESDYPVSDTIRIRIGLVEPRKFTLSLRIPYWSEDNSLSVNGITENNPVPKSYVKLTRIWRPGDVVTLRLDLRARLIRSPAGGNYVAVMRGPILLARDTRISSSDVDGPVSLQGEKTGFIDATQVAVNTAKYLWLIFDVPLTTSANVPHSSVLMCDFSSAGNTFTSKSKYRVWMPLTLNVRPSP